MKNIINNAQNSNETQISNTITINRIDSEWKQDSIDKSYAYKVYSVQAGSSIMNYTVDVTKEGSESIGGIKITDENNQEKSTKFLERFYSVFDEAKEKGIIRNLDSQLIFSLLENITLQVIRFLMNEPSEKAKEETIENSFWLCWNGLKTI